MLGCPAFWSGMNHIEPLDPNSAEGRRVQIAMTQWIEDVIDRLEREGKPVPACLVSDPELEAGTA